MTTPKKDNTNPNPVPIEEALRRIARAGPIHKVAKKKTEKKK
jgi:hypothetical protein